jgi:ADP-ribosylation factor GTPase-activating protein 2/3
VQLDSWTIDQLRVMKVGGNFAAKDCNMTGVDAKTKYTSRQMQQYKAKLQKLVEQDIRRYPDELVLEHTEQPVVKESDDFFAEWGDSEAVSTPKEPVVTKLSFKPPFQDSSKPGFGQGRDEFHTVNSESVTANSPATSGWKEESLKPKKVEMGMWDKNGDSNDFNTSSSGFEVPSMSATKTTPAERVSLTMNSTTSASSAPRKKIGSRKVTKGIDFEQAAKDAEAEQNRIIAEKAMEAQKISKPRAPSASATHNSTGNFNRGSVEPVKEVEQKFQKFGFGFDPSSLPPADTQNTGVGHKKINSNGKPPSGMGFGATPSGPSETMERFGNAKSISSDQYFNRGSYGEQSYLMF